MTLGSATTDLTMIDEFWFENGSLAMGGGTLTLNGGGVKSGGELNLSNSILAISGKISE